LIQTFVPYSPEKDLAQAYNDCLEMLRSDEDWACLLDHDAMFLHPKWYSQLQGYIDKYPECECFTCLVSRTGGVRQRPKLSPTDADLIKRNPDHIKTLQIMAEKIKDAEQGNIENFTTPAPHHLCGTLILVKKSLWKRIGGFSHWYTDNKILGVDSNWHQRLYEGGEKLYIMKGVFIYHWYRGGANTTKHLQ